MFSQEFKSRNLRRSDGGVGDSTDFQLKVWNIVGESLFTGVPLPTGFIRDHRWCIGKLRGR